MIKSCPSKKHIPAVIPFFVYVCVGVRGLLEKFLSCAPDYFCLGDPGETVEALLNHQCFVLMTVIMQKSPMSYQNWSTPSSKMLIMDSCARELKAGNNNQIFTGVKNPSFQELREVLTQDLHDYSAA